MVCSSAPHSQAAEEAIPHFNKHERKRTTAVRRRLSRTQALLGRVIPGECTDIGDENVESCGVVRPLRIPVVIRPKRRKYVVIVRGTVELLCGGYKWVSWFEAPCICTRWTGER